MAFKQIPSFGSETYKDPVQTSGNLPASGNSEGDIIFVKTGAELYYWDGAAWQLLVGSGSGLSNLNAQTGSSQTFAAGTSGTDFNISSAGNVHTFNIPNATALARGLVSTLSQTFAGDKTFNDDIIANSMFTLNSVEHQVSTATLTDNSSGVATSFDVSKQYAVIDYSISRSTNFRTGRMLIVTNGSSANIVDDNVEIGDTGITFSVAISGPNVNVNYTSTSTGFNASFKNLTKRW